MLASTSAFLSFQGGHECVKRLLSLSVKTEEFGLPDSGKNNQQKKRDANGTEIKAHRKYIER